jgi:hypothetical protein
MISSKLKTTPQESKQIITNNSQREKEVIRNPSNFLDYEEPVPEKPKNLGDHTVFFDRNSSSRKNTVMTNSKIEESSPVNRGKVEVLDDEINKNYTEDEDDYSYYDQDS